MALTENEFLVLRAAKLSNRPLTQREIADQSGLSLGNVNTQVRACKESGWIDEHNMLTDAGEEALKPYKVQNAVIMAAGLSSRFAPISYEMPKGLLRVRGEILIERQIRQLQESGITDIVVVVGYKKENFFYLEHELGVEIRVNADYDKRNNNSTLKLVEDKLSNTYICSSDNYFTENVFEPYVYEAYYSCVWSEGPTDEYVVELGPRDRIVKSYVGGEHMRAILGHAYFDRAFSEEFIRVLNEDYDKPETAQKLWDDVWIDHIDTLHFVSRLYPDGIVYEFDSLADLQDFDPEFINNVDSSILDNICEYLGCSRGDITGIVPIKQGLTNLSFRFSVGDNQYVYRHPGVGTNKIISRESETFSLRVAKELDIDETFLFEDPEAGWKLSKFIPDCVDFDYHNPDEVAEALRLVKKLHTSGVVSPFEFNLMEKAEEIITLLRQENFVFPRDFDHTYHVARACYEATLKDSREPVLCHMDFYGPNILVGPDKIRLIDWEYSAMGDYASDLGNFIACSDYTYDESLKAIQQYFDGQATPSDIRHCVAYVAITAFYWYVWALYKDFTGDSVGEWMYLWYRAVFSYGTHAKRLYDEA